MRFYIVQPVDTLSKIALRYNTTVDALMSLNNIINPELIYPGQVIAIPAATSPCPPLQKGDCDATTAGAVSELQALLNSKSNSKLEIDGLFEALTEKAVKNFQVSRGITPSGVVNLATWAALGINCAPTPTPTIPPTIPPTIIPIPSTPPGFTCPLLELGSTGNAVLFLQTLLTSKGYSTGALDSNFGPITLSALNSFQQNNNLSVTGTTTPSTWLALGVICPTTTPTPTPTPTATTTPTATISPTPTPPPGFSCQLLGYGSTGGAVLFLQTLLRDAGFSPGALDGVFGQLTLKALSDFQRSRNIEVTGTTTNATWLALGVACPTVTPTPTTTPTPTITPTPTAPPGFSCPLLSYGSTGDAVLFLQSRLNANGFSPGPLDGIFGQQTLFALNSFQQSRNLSITGTTTPQTWLALGVTCPTSTPTPTPTVTPSPTPTATVTPTPTIPPTLESLWFYVPSQSAWNSLQTHYRLINVLIPFWYGITPSGEIIDNTEQQVLNFAQSKSIPVYGLIHNFQNGIFDPQLIGNILRDPGLRTRLVSNILELVTLHGLAGVNIDFEFVPPDQRSNLTAFMAELYQTLHGAGYKVTIDVPAKTSDDPLNTYSGAFDYANLARYADEVILLTQDEHYLAFPNPGPIASIPYDRSVLNYAVTLIPPSKIKLTIPVYGYDWPAGSTGTTVGGADAILLAQTTGSQIIFDPVNLVPHFTYTRNNVTHEVWFENDVSFAIKIDLAREYRLSGFAVWRLGLEDPGVWDVLDTYI